MKKYSFVGFSYLVALVNFDIILLCGTFSFLFVEKARQWEYFKVGVRWQWERESLIRAYSLVRMHAQNSSVLTGESDGRTLGWRVFWVRMGVCVEERCTSCSRDFLEAHGSSDDGFAYFWLACPCRWYLYVLCSSYRIYYAKRVECQHVSSHRTPPLFASSSSISRRPCSSDTCPCLYVSLIACVCVNLCSWWERWIYTVDM